MRIPPAALRLVLLLLAPCACRASHDSAHPDAILPAPGGIAVSATADAWPGDASVPRHVAVVRVAVRNDGDRPLRLYLEDMRLLDDRGDVHAPLPLYDIDDAVDGSGQVLRPAHDPFPDFHHERFLVAGAYRPFYPALPVHRPPRGSASSDELRDHDHGERYDEWRLMPPLPTPRMVDLAIPEGVVDSGGYVSGFVFFERVDDSVGATFVLDLVDADSGERVGEVTLTLAKQRAGA